MFNTVSKHTKLLVVFQSVPSQGDPEGVALGGGHGRVRGANGGSVGGLAGGGLTTVAKRQKCDATRRDCDQRRTWLVT